MILTLNFSGEKTNYSCYALITITVIRPVLEVDLGGTIIWLEHGYRFFDLYEFEI